MWRILIVCGVAVALLGLGCKRQQPAASDDLMLSPAMEGESLEPIEPAPVAEPDMSYLPPPVAPMASQTHVVQRGDTLYGLARQYYGDGKLWTVIRDANPGKVKNGTIISIGTELTIPPKP
jgi:5'-nucleotidase